MTREDDAIRRADDVLSSRLSSYLASAREMALLVKEFASEVREARKLKADYLGLQDEVQKLREQLKPCEKCSTLGPELEQARYERDLWKERHARLAHLTGNLSDCIYEAPIGAIPNHGLYVKRFSHDIINAVREELRRWPM